MRRIERLRSVIETRQFDLHLVIEDIHDPHNVLAILRTCDAVGVGSIHLVYTFEDFPKLSKLGKQSSAGTFKWANLVHHNSIEECYQVLREEGCRIYATDLSDRAVDLYELDLTGPIALVFGNEHRGVTEEASRLADGNFLIPMHGLAQSLNVSVACAVTLYEAMRQRRASGGYEKPTSSQENVERMLKEWAEK